MSNNELDETQDQVEEYVEQEENSSPSGASLFVDRIKAWLNTQNKLAVFGIGGVIVVALGYLGYRNLYQLPREKEATAAIYRTQALFDVDSFKLVLKDAPRLAEKYSGTKGGELATYMAGCSYLYTGDFKKAIQYLEDADFSDKVMKVQVKGLLGDAYVETKDLEKGLKHYLDAAKAAKGNSDFSAVWWYRKAARVYEKKDDWKNALEVYETLKKDYHDEELVLEINKFIYRAKAKLGES